MLRWFHSKPQCPVDPTMREWIDKRWHWLEAEFGLDRLLDIPVILPRAEFFPDPYHGTSDDARRMLDKVCEYMGIDPSTIEFKVYADDNPVFDGKFQQRTLGLYESEEGTFRIWVEYSNLADPLRMVATMAHELGHVYLLGHGRITDDIEDHEPLTDLLTVFLGMGVFTANAVIRDQESGFGAYRVRQTSRGGYLGMREYGYAFAKFARARGEDGSAWVRELRPDVRAAFKQAMRFLAEETPAREE
jgi:hypothetical protein